MRSQSGRQWKMRPVSVLCCFSCNVVLLSWKLRVFRIVYFLDRHCGNSSFAIDNGKSFFKKYPCLSKAGCASAIQAELKSPGQRQLNFLRVCRTPKTGIHRMVFAGRECILENETKAEYSFDP